MPHILAAAKKVEEMKVVREKMKVGTMITTDSEEAIEFETEYHEAFLDLKSKIAAEMQAYYDTLVVENTALREQAARRTTAADPTPIE